MARRLAVLPLVLALVSPLPAAAQSLQDWGFDPSVLMPEGRDLVMRAPDASIDGLFQAVHASAQSSRDADALCALFDPDAERSLEGYNDIASRLSEGSRVRFADAVSAFFLSAAQSPRQAFDATRAGQSLKAAGVRAAILNDGFLAGLNGNEHTARCRSVGWLLDALQAQPVAERASVMRLLLSQGLDYLALAGTLPR